MAYPRFQLSRGFKKARRTSGNRSYALTTWGDFENTLDIVLAAQVGDEIEVAVSCRWGGESVYGFLDAVTVVAGVPVNSFATQGAPSGTSEGVMAWFGIGVPANVNNPIGGGLTYVIQAGDLSSGFVTLRLRRRNATAAVKTMIATADNAFQWWAKNLGPADPN